ncbi:MAG: DUF3887 domain-containing protein [Lachnospiraceae bacterium]|jgi:hypothetical protein|nr:DUF3887 domain-containing protein [Lachnospiraceae bacterium]
MEAKSYVNRIIRRVKCTGKRRGELKRQLLSDIAFRQEDGESLEQVIKAMGAPREVAREFNQNLSPREKKRFILKWVLISCVSFLLLVTICCGIFLWMLPKGYPMGYSGTFSQEQVRESSEHVIRLFEEGNYEDMRELSSEKMKEIITNEVLERAREQVSGDWGAFQSFGNAYFQEVVQQGQEMALIQLNVSYEHTSVTYTMMFDQEMKLTGFYIR